MHTDCAVLTGTQHTVNAVPCQDYCLAETREERAFALVADGCSSGAQSDLGARAWALAARRVLRRLGTIESDASVLEAAVMAEAAPALAELDFEDGFSTLVLLQAHGLRVCATFFGDGALLVRHLDGTLTLVNVEYTGNAPDYLNYKRRPSVRSMWVQSYGAQDLMVTTNRYSADGELLSLRVSTAQGDAGPWSWAGHVDRDELEMVMVATDGVDSRDEGFIATGTQLLAVKSSAGGFLRRRVGRLARDWTQANTMPSDDLAVAGLWLGSGQGATGG